MKNPELNVVKFENNDVIATSGGGSTPLNGIYFANTFDGNQGSYNDNIAHAYQYDDEGVVSFYNMAGGAVIQKDDGTSFATPFDGGRHGAPTHLTQLASALNNGSYQYETQSEFQEAYKENPNAMNSVLANATFYIKPDGATDAVAVKADLNGEWVDDNPQLLTLSNLMNSRTWTSESMSQPYPTMPDYPSPYTGTAKDAYLLTQYMAEQGLDDTFEGGQIIVSTSAIETQPNAIVKSDLLQSLKNVGMSDDLMSKNDQDLVAIQATRSSGDSFTLYYGTYDPLVMSNVNQTVSVNVNAYPTSAENRNGLAIYNGEGQKTTDSLADLFNNYLWDFEYDDFDGDGTKEARFVRQEDATYTINTNNSRYLKDYTLEIDK